MEFEKLIRERYSVRKFSDKPVEEEKLAAVLEAARVAPTAVNKQPQRVLVIRNRQGLEKLAACTPYTFQAPLALVVCYNREEAWVRPYDGDNAGAIDAAIVGTHIMLAIHDIGLGATWVGHFDVARFRQEFNLPAHIEPVAIFPMGYLAAEAKPAHLHAKRKPLEETVVYDSF